MRKIALGSDHGGFDLKEAIKKHLEKRGFWVEDVGCPDRSSCDYPIYAKAASKLVAEGDCEKGILVCTTGIGISIAANKTKGIRCALCSDSFQAKMTRLHNDANMLALGGGIVGVNLGLEIVDVFLETEFSGEDKHVRRIALIEEA